MSKMYPDTVLSKILIECCKESPDHSKLEFFVNEFDEWNILLDATYTHGVYPLLAQAISQIENVPDEIKSIVKNTNRQITFQNMIMTNELVKIMRLFESNGIDVIAFKGPILSHMIHGNVVQRQYADLDILLCNREDLYRAGKLLLTNKFTYEHSLEYLKNTALLKIFKDVTFQNDKVSLEIHWKLFEDKFIRNNNANRFQYATEFYNLDQNTLRSLKAESLLFYLCIHGSKHFWERIEWIVDIDRLVRRNNNLDWPEMSRYAETMQSTVMYYLGLELARQLFNTPLPESVVKKIESIQKVSDLMEIIFKQFSENPIIQQYEEKISWEYLKMSSMIHDTPLLAMKTFMKNIFQIKVEDVYLINLPRVLSPLYYVIRPFRLLSDYFRYRNKRS